jgi:hypothetical protein
MAKKKEKVKPIIFINYRTSSIGGEPYPGQEGKTNFIETSPVEIDVVLDKLELITGGIALNGDGIDYDFDVEKFIGKSLFMVYVRYSTGDTFGSSSGNPYFPGIYDSYEKADAVVKSIEDGTYDGYKPWYGYFDSLDSVEVVEKRLIDRRK